MKELIRRFSGVIFDLRVVVGSVGIVLSVVVHELFHIIVHWGDIRSVALFPDSSAIVEVIFAPSGEYDLVFEEAIAYTVTMVALVLTVMLVYEIHDLRDEKSIRQIMLTQDLGIANNLENELRAYSYLGRLLGLSPTTTQDARGE